ncbi:hypothetical protein SAMN05421819_1702 [Bryocella elongata]|uniref:Membrane protein YfhO n=1 Tax=Bryocella elongata TaxID=863522 RepID=A0A1H5WQL2_9BACT|nr:hypothetical protein [Bryocella elongata]SEG01829.1 hypothetical protein SAMN05421819_1702 [Bryocella elongata]
MSSSESPTRAQRFAWLLVPLFAFLAVHPLVVHGCSCGHDFEFHLESWLDAAQQMRHGTLYPQWAFTAAWNAGEPRFVFYPPLSWMLGALLTMALPLNAVPIVFTWLALTGAGLSMYFLARPFASTPAALLASAIYLANPYILFTGFERTAYAELLAAAWMPLIVMAALNARARPASIAIPLALLWLTNAPAAVIGSYGFALIVALSLATQWHQTRTQPDHAKDLAKRALLATAGPITGILLVGFYLVPAAYEQRWVQIAMATLPNMRVEDSFLFGHTSDAGHNMVLHTASMIAVVLMTGTAVLLAVAWMRRDRIASEHRRPLLSVLAVTTAILLFLLTPVSLFVWHLLPKLAFLQFPWRLLSLEGVMLGLAVALALPRNKLSLRTSALLSILFTLGMSATANHLYRQACDTDDLPSARAALLASHHGMQPTDEYTPRTADNDSLRTTNPAYWLAGDLHDPNVPAPGTQPNPVQVDPNFDPNDLDDAQTVSANAPLHLNLHLAMPRVLILNLRDYPAWEVTRTGPDSLSLETPKPYQRDDGLLAIALPAGDSTIDVRWHRTPDHNLGLALSLAGLAILGLASGLPWWRSRRMRD